MPVSGTSYLYSLWPPMAEAVRYLLAYAQYYNFNASIVSGLRSPQEQTRLYAIGRTPNEIAQGVSKQGRDGSVTDAQAGQSAHNYGLAVDIEGPDQRSVIALARAIGFGLVSWDPAHIEWPNWRNLIR
jgi:hypothetical protein